MKRATLLFAPLLLGLPLAAQQDSSLLSGGNTTVHLRERLMRFVDETLGPPAVPMPSTAGATP